jgi:hypothetical protein
LPCNSGQTERKVGSKEDLDAATITDIREFAPKPAKGISSMMQRGVLGN